MSLFIMRTHDGQFYATLALDGVLYANTLASAEKALKWAQRAIAGKPGARRRAT
jgi:hypothetical protein